MTAPTISEYLKFANVQMAAESLFGFDAIEANGSLNPGEASTRPLTSAQLISGNRHASKFTTTEAAKFAAEWEVVEHKSNTTTGFSGTLFKHKTTNEYIISFRSTEFLDDAARDNQATNTLEIKEKGWAFGQIDDMEAWYKHLTDANATYFVANCANSMRARRRFGNKSRHRLNLQSMPSTGQANKGHKV